MDKHKNAPAEQAQSLSKDCKMGTPDRKLEDLLEATSDYYREALKKLAEGESSVK